MADQKVTDDQLIDMFNQGLSNRQIGANLGMHPTSIDARKKRLVAKGYSPDHDMTHHCPDGYTVKGVSTYYNKDGKPTGQWVKTNADHERFLEIQKEAFTALCEELKPVKPIKGPKRTASDLLNLHVLTDYHMGMLSWDEETGGNWDLQIAEALLINWFTYAIHHAPDAEVGVLAQMGDFLHFDSLEAVTPASKHILDADSRYQKVVRSAIRCLRHIVDLMLAKYGKVHVIVSDANHDPIGGVWLREMLSALYERNRRITIDVSPATFNVYEHGLTSLFFHHGHKKKPENIHDVFASMFRDVFGRTKFSYAHMGHQHHKLAKETNLMIIEQHRTMAEKDAYAARGGWLAGRSADVITYSKIHGEVGRLTTTPAMLV